MAKVVVHVSAHNERVIGLFFDGKAVHTIGVMLHRLMADLINDGYKVGKMTYRFGITEIRLKR